MPAAVRRLGGPLLVAAVVITIDQLTKHWALNALVDRDIDVIGPLRFNLAFNTGMAFSSGEGLGRWIGLLAIAVVAVLLRIVSSEGTTRLQLLAAGLITGGALGNIIDRLFRAEGWMRGGVVDFIDVQFWPIFNVADMGVVIGALLLVFATLIAPSSPPTAAPETENQAPGSAAPAEGVTDER